MIRVTIQASKSAGGAPELTETRDLSTGEALVLGRAPGGTGIALAGEKASRRHCELVADMTGLSVADLGSTNGTRVGGQTITSVRLEPGQVVQAGEWHITVSFEIIEDAPAPAASFGSATRHITTSGATFDETQDYKADIPNQAIVDVGQVFNGTRGVQEIAYCAIGAGLGSFVWVDHLRCYGVHEDDILTIGPEAVPYRTYQRYCANSQIPDHERLRSNSASTPDNIWGWPGYAFRESFTTGNPRWIFEVFGEPTLAQSYTPRAGRVFRSLDRESKRIKWDKMFRDGLVQALRMTNDGRYAIYWRASAGTVAEHERNQVIVARIVHISTGYPATRFVDDFQNFLSAHPDKRHHVANAYEPHQHVYQDIEASTRPFNVVVRGRGIVASRVLQRLTEARKRNPNLRILQSIRSPIRSQVGAKWRWASRPVRDHVELQPFNWPKSAWGGDVRKIYERADEQERGKILNIMGGTTTAERSDWLAISEQGGEEGWYRAIFGSVKDIQPNGNTLAITINTTDGYEQAFEADYLVDCTGLVADLSRSLFVGDLLNTYNLPQNHAWRERNGTWEKGAKTGLQVSNDFEIEGLRNGNGRVYGAGNITTGGPYLGVDSFLGLQYSALRSVDHIGAERVTRLRPIGPFKSFGQWVAWCTNSSPT